MNQVGSAPEDGSAGSSVCASGVTVSIGATTNICQVSVTPGTWRIRVWVGFDRGAPVIPTDNNNMRIQASALAVMTLPILPVVGRLDKFDVVVRVPDGATTLIAVQSIGAGTAGVGYLAGMTADKIRGS